MKGINTEILSTIIQHAPRPPLFKPGEPLFWNDPHISKGMLAAHLNPDNDAASRRPETIDKEVNYLVSSGIIKPGDRLLDLGCGPGLYAGRLAAKGIKVTGIDFSERSLNYAIAQARKHNLAIEYRLLDFFDLDYVGEFDAVIQVNGELNTFSGEKLDILLAKLHAALKPDGLLIFDVTTRELRTKYGLKNGWYASEGGFWRPGYHLVLEQGFDYPEENVWLDRYIVIENDSVKIYHIWYHDYDLESLRRVLDKSGFRIEHAWNDFTGTPYEAGGEWLVVVARKR